MTLVICVTLCQSCMTALLISSMIDTGPKDKEIIFKEGYIGQGSIKKREFYDNREATFLSQTKDKIIEGTIKYDDKGRALISGTWNVAPNAELEGTFFISNTPDGFLSAKNNSGKLKIAVKNINEYTSETFHLKKIDSDKYSIDYTGFSDNTIARIKGEVRRGYVEKYGYDNISELLKKSTNHKVSTKDNAYFNGNLSIAENSNNDIYLEFKDGTWSLHDRWIKSIHTSKPSATTNLITIDVNLKNLDIEQVKFALASEEKIYDVKSLIQLFLQSKVGKLTYLSSSDVFDGTYEIVISDNNIMNIIPVKGTYTLCNGQKLRDNWIEEYELTEEEREYVKGHTTPTAQHETATALVNERYYNAHYVAAEYALEKREYQKAMNLFEEAGKYKNTEEMNRRAQEVSSLIKEEEKKQLLIEKYGAYWGALVYSKEFTLGMTREMCVDIVEDLSVYNINKSEDSWSGTTETWRINYDSIGMATMLFDDLGLIASSYYLKKYPKYMRFRNGKLTEITYNEN